MKKKNVKNKIKKVICGTLAVLTMMGCVLLPATSVFASDVEPIKDVGSVGSITVTYVDEGDKIKDGQYVKSKVLIDGATFSAMLVAKEGNGRFEWIDAIEANEDFFFDTENMYTANGMEKVAKELVKVFGDAMNSYERVTDENGQCTFANLEQGIYLIWESGKIGTAERYHDCVPLLVEVPDREVEPYDFSVDVFPKPSRITEKKITVTGEKEWKGDGGTKTVVVKDKEGNKTTKEVRIERPDSIILRLYANDVEVAETTTTAEKGWAFSFNDVNAVDQNGDDVEFTIKEDKVKNYVFSQVKVTKGENTVVIDVLNTYKDESAKTGDETNMFLWIGLMGLCAVGLVILFIPKKKKQKDEEVVDMVEDSDNAEDINNK